MIAWLQGRLLRKNSDSILIDVHGVGYQVFVSKQVLERLPPVDAQVVLHIHTQVKEDAIQLYGFLDDDEQEAFRALIGINGIGPKMAITVLSGISAPELARAVCTEDLARLCLVPGVGKKKAERMVVELRDRLTPLVKSKTAEKDSTTITMEELRSALVNLGFKTGEVEKAVTALRQDIFEGIGLEVLLPEALKRLRG